MIENIRYSLYPKINSKTEFITQFSEHINKSVHTLHNHWFARFWAIPTEHQEKTVDFMQKYIATQNKKS